ncbi:hypothetical protein C8J57DRAFT_163112 [Mycena rebaudengoi]|nr:hypothetical protein C8J57DRAFT_163112 [Mycena rebaudengoi]
MPSTSVGTTTTTTATRSSHPKTITNTTSQQQQTPRRSARFALVASTSRVPVSVNPNHHAGTPRSLRALRRHSGDADGVLVQLDNRNAGGSGRKRKSPDPQDGGGVVRKRRCVAEQPPPPRRGKARSSAHAARVQAPAPPPTPTPTQTKRRSPRARRQQEQQTNPILLRASPGAGRLDEIDMGVVHTDIMDVDACEQVHPDHLRALRAKRDGEVRVKCEEPDDVEMPSSPLTPYESPTSPTLPLPAFLSTSPTTSPTLPTLPTPPSPKPPSPTLSPALPPLTRRSTRTPPPGRPRPVTLRPRPRVPPAARRCVTTGVLRDDQSPTRRSHRGHHHRVFIRRYVPPPAPELCRTLIVFLSSIIPSILTPFLPFFFSGAHLIRIHTPE